MNLIRKPAVAGLFYPDNEKDLRNNIVNLMNKARSEFETKNILGIISPHAGYIYSGYSAAHGFNALKQKKFNTAVILSPSHSEYFPGISVYSGDAYQTPFGLIPININKRKILSAGNEEIFEGIEGHRKEHAVEVQLPFLQVINKEFDIVPVVIGDQSKKYIDIVADKLVDIIDDKTIVVASSDLSHFYDKATADKLDSIVQSRIENFEFDELQSDLEKNKCEACGGGAIVALMKSAYQVNFRKSKILSRTDSGDFSGDNRRVVGYLSAVVYN